MELVTFFFRILLHPFGDILMKLKPPPRLHLKPTFNLSLEIEEDTDNHITSDMGAIPMRSILDKTGIISFLVSGLYDPRDQSRIVHSLAQLLIQCILMLAQGWGMLQSYRVEDDPAMKASCQTKRGCDVTGPDVQLASQPTMSRLLSLLSTAKNYARLSKAILKLGLEHMLARNGGRRQAVAILDADSMAIEAHGNQQGAKYNGHYKQSGFLPQIISNGETGDVLGARLRPGTDPETKGFPNFIIEIALKVKHFIADQVILRLDAGFNGEQTCTPLEDNGIHYIMRVARNRRLNQMAAPYLHDCREDTVRYVELVYKADKWSRSRRVILVIRPRPEEIFDGYYFLVTSLDPSDFSGEEIAKIYRQRGKAELHQGEMKAACKFAFPSSPRKKSHYRGRELATIKESVPVDDDKVGMENAVRLLLYMLVYQLMHIGRCTLHSPPDQKPEMQALASVRDIEWSSLDVEGSTESCILADETQTTEEEPHMHIRTFREQVLKVGAIMARHGRYIRFRIAQSAVEAWKRLWEHFGKLDWHELPNF